MEQLDRVLSQVKDEYSPDAGARQRIRLALSASVAAGALVGSSGVGTAAAAAVPGAGTAKGLAAGGSLLWAKIIAGAGVVAAVAGVGLSVRHGEPKPPPRHAVAPPAAAAMPARPSRAAVPEREVPAPRPEAADPGTPPPQSTRRAASVSRSRVSESRSSTMLADVRLLSEASRELRAGRVEDAQRVLGEHARRFPDSVLGDERRGLAVLASCGRSRTPEHRAAAERFVQAAPSSPLADTIRKQCLE
jgi:hypothetical protein